MSAITNSRTSETGEFKAYENLVQLEPFNAPQRQGITEEDYITAVQDNRVAITRVRADNRGVAIRVPQLMPVEMNGWLNEDYYASRFQTELETGALRFFSDLPNGVPDDEVTIAARDLASRSGAIVFDYPTADAEYPERVRSFLHDAGIDIVEDVELGYQSYFIGQVIIKKGFDPERPVLNLGTALDMVQAMPGYREQQRSASFGHFIGEEQAKKLHDFYKAAFEELNEHPCRQGLDTDEFLRMVTSDDSVYKVYYPTNGEVETVILLGDDLGKFTWLNQKFYQNHYPSQWLAQQILYYPAFATDPNKQGGRNTEVIVGMIAKAIEAGNNPTLVAFDCCDKNGFLAPMLEAVINETPEISIELNEVGRQQYSAYRLASQLA